MLKLWNTLNPWKHDILILKVKMIFQRRELQGITPPLQKTHRNMFCNIVVDEYWEVVCRFSIKLLNNWQLMDPSFICILSLFNRHLIRVGEQTNKMKPFCSAICWTFHSHHWSQLLIFSLLWYWSMSQSTLLPLKISAKNCIACSGSSSLQYMMAETIPT